MLIEKIQKYSLLLKLSFFIQIKIFALINFKLLNDISIHIVLRYVCIRFRINLRV